MSALVIFKAIGSALDRRKLFEKLTTFSGEITMRDKADHSFVLTAVSMNDHGQIQCRATEDSHMKYSFKDVLTATFSMNGEKYLFETSVVPYKDGVNLTVHNLFHLQRRKNFRYVLPKNYVGEFHVKKLNNKPCEFSCALMDLSTEGCAMTWTMDMNSLQLEDTVEAELCLGDRKPIPVQGVIKNLRMKSDTEFVLGVQFDHMAKASEHQIVSTLTDLQREIYLRKAG